MQLFTQVYRHFHEVIKTNDVRWSPRFVHVPIELDCINKITYEIYSDHYNYSYGYRLQVSFDGLWLKQS